MKDIIPMLKKIPFLLCTVFLLALFVVLHNAQAGSLAHASQGDGAVIQHDDATAKDGFIKLFHNVPWGAWRNISNEASPYLLGKRRDEALAFLENCGFTVVEVSDPKSLEKRKQHYKREKGLELDQIFYAGRGPGWRFWRFATDYDVYIFLEKEKVVYVVAKVDGFLNKMP